MARAAAFPFAQSKERNKEQRQEARDFGMMGEQMASNYLEEQGYSIVKRNDRLHHLEVDIIALKDNVLHFVEVKARMSEALQPAEAAVDVRKAKRIIAVADKYILSQNRQETAQFDIITVVREGDGFTLHHIEDAFNAMTLSLSQNSPFR